MKQVRHLRTVAPALLLAITLIHIALHAAQRGPGEFLTGQEIEQIQTKQDIGPRVEYYLGAARLRLESAAARLRGEEAVEGDPMEYFTPEDMLDGYYRILNSVMLNLEDAYRKPLIDSKGIQKALKDLRKKTEEFQKLLDSLKSLARERENTELLRLIRKAADITRGAHEGAAHALKEKLYERQ
jgi:Xaa-Pro aminopeptidase